MSTVFLLRRCVIGSVIIGLAVLASFAAQAQSGSLHGQVTGPFDGRVTNAPMRVVHIASGDSWQTRTNEEGRYEFANLPVGEFRVQVRVTCCEYMPYQSELIELRAGNEQVFDIQLDQGFQLANER